MVVDKLTPDQITALGGALAVVIAAVLGAGVWKSRKDVKTGRPMLTEDHLDEELVSVKGEIRQLRQENRLEHKDIRADIAGLRDILIEIRATMRRY